MHQLYIIFFSLIPARLVLCVTLHANDEYVYRRSSSVIKLEAKRTKLQRVVCSMEMTKYILRMNDDGRCNERDTRKHTRASYSTIQTSFRCRLNNYYIEISFQGHTSCLSLFFCLDD